MCDVVDVEAVSDAAPAAANAEVAAYSVYVFQHTDIRWRDQAQPGPEFVREMPSKCVIHFEEGDVDISDGVRALAGPGRALDTEAHQNACAVHAVFGTPSRGGRLAAPDARRLAVSLLSQAPLKATSSGTIRDKQGLLLRTFWEEFMLRHFRGERSAEIDLFAEALRNTAPQVAEECRQKYIQYQNKLETVRITKEKVSQQSANFFTASLEPFVRKLAVEIGYLPAVDDSRSPGVYEGLKQAIGADGFIRGSRSAGSAQLTKFDGLFDTGSAFNAIREDFLVHGDRFSTPQRLLDTIARLLQSSEPLSTEAEIFRGTLALWAQVASVDESPPLPFFNVAWSAYLRAIESNRYFFLADELVLMCELANVNVAIFKHLGDTLRYHSGVFGNPGRIACVKLLCNDRGAVHSHYERVLTHNDICQLSLEGALQDLQRAREAEAERLRDEERLGEDEDQERARLNDSTGGEEINPSTLPVVPDGVGDSSKELPAAESDAEESEQRSAKSLSDASSDAASDAEDVFSLVEASVETLPEDYQDLFLYRWQVAAVELSEQHFRGDLTLPLDPMHEEGNKVWSEVDHAVKLPTWHCRFRDCKSNSDNQGCSSHVNHELGVWMHLWNTKEHTQVLRELINKYSLTDGGAVALAESAFALVTSAALLRERQNCPLVGIATDRRSHAHLKEVFYEENVTVTMCFVCGCKHIQHRGFDKFGLRQEKGTIAYRDHGDFEAVMKSILGDDSYRDFWDSNLSAKRFKATFGEAVQSDPFLQEDEFRFEWKRRVFGRDDEAFCCPEDVLRGGACQHDDNTVCSKCRIPVCNECWGLAKRKEKIPKALANDNFIGYAHPFIGEANVTWLEATIAAPVFNGLVTYYIEGDQGDRHNLMQVGLGNAQKSWGVRGNVFSFLLPWESVLRQLFLKIEDGDLSQWPLAPDMARQLVRVSLTRGPEALVSKFKELSIRSGVVKRLAHIYIEKGGQDLADRPGVLKIHSYEGCASASSSLKQHADRRIDRLYPPELFGSESGALLPGLLEALAEERRAAQDSARTPSDSVFDMKQSTMHDTAENVEQLFQHVRPSIVTDEGASADALPPEVVLEQGLGSVATMQVRMSNKFEEQFISKYMPRIFPWALNYDCGGPEFPGLFENWTEMITDQEQLLQRGIKQRWRKMAGEAAVLPGDYAKMLSTRAEMQVGADWVLVPAARNLHWRYEVLHSAFMTCKQSINPGESLEQNLDDLILAVRKILGYISKNTVTINGEKKNINGNMGMLFSVDNITSEEKRVLRAYLNTTANIAGCQAIRKKIGHICFGMRVVYGEVIFVTVSPGRRHSSMILKLSRARRNDTSLRGDDDVKKARRDFCGKDMPKIFSETCYIDDVDAELVSKEIELPPLFVRQACR